LNRIRNDKIIIFGAGKIGRSFIGQLFSRGGYEVVFVDIQKELIDELNRRGQYKVIIKAETEKVLYIRHVRGVWAKDDKKVIEEIATAGILAISVGVNGLPDVIPLVAKGLNRRHEIDNSRPLDIIIAENIRDAAVYVHDMLSKVLPSGYPLSQMAGLIETSIGKMVPIMRKKDLEEDMLQVFAEPYNMLILDKQAFKNPIPRIEGLDPKENMKAWVDRKLFIHNLGHAATVYIGHLYNPDFIFLYEALSDSEIHSFVKETMLQSADILLMKYPDEFTRLDLVDHIDDLLYRFQNKALGDTIFRVGCDLSRKIGPEDRLSGLIKLASEQRQSYNKILFVLVCACHFKATDEDGMAFPGDIEFLQLYKKSGIKGILTSIGEFDESKYQPLIMQAEIMDQNLKILGIRNQIKHM
jgi:mannitol-1-phosphate 5-dehydrogenase